MKIFVKNDDGIMYEAFQVDENTYKFKAENKTFELSLQNLKLLMVLAHQQRNRRRT